MGSRKWVVRDIASVLLIFQSDGRGNNKNLGRGNNSILPKKNTVASMLAQARGDKLSLHPELTIEPIYKCSEQSKADQEGEEFDQSKGGRRLSTYIDSEGRLQIKTVCESPEIRNLSERDSEEGLGSDSDHPEDGKNMEIYLLVHLSASPSLVGIN